MMFGTGRSVRIPMPTAKAGFKDRWKYRSRTGSQRSIRLRLYSRRNRSTRLREGIVEEALLYRSWIRWALLSVLWGTITVGMFLFPAFRISPGQAGLILVLALSFFAGFNRNRLARALASIAILFVAGLFAAYGGIPEVAMGLGLPGGALLLLNTMRL